MSPLTYKEAYILALLQGVNHDIKLKPLSMALLGLYACDFLDLVQTKQEGLTDDARIDDYFLMPGDFWNGKDLLFPALKKLQTLKRLECQPQKFLKYFSLLHLKPSPPFPSFHKHKMDHLILQALENSPNLPHLKKIVEVFNAKLFHLLTHFSHTAHAHYEIRFFYPPPTTPQLYGPVFHLSSFHLSHEKDTYFLNDEGLNLKMRSGALYVKPTLHNGLPISCFMQKETADTPLDLQTYTPIQVSKERYIQQLDHGSKIELSLIHLQGQKWTTVSVESPHLDILFALSLLINPEGGEKLSYSEFLHARKYQLGPS